MSAARRIWGLPSGASRDNLPVSGGRYPDFFIVGVPRAGTTAMFDYLAAHPQVFAAPIKEPQFFASDLDSGSYLESVTFMRDRERYLEMFAGTAEGQLAGEGSTWYMYSQVAAQAIHDANPDARIIVMLRHPVHMLYSLHGRRIYAGSEDIRDFSQALAAEDDRRAGRRIPPQARNPKALLYHDVGRFGEQLERFLDVFSRDRLHVIVFDDFIADPEAAYRSTAQFLGIDPDFTPDLKVINAGAARRSQRIQRVLLSKPVVATARVVIPKRARPYVGRTWDALNSRKEKREPLDATVAAQLRADLLPDIRKTGDLIGRDLESLWT